MAKFLTKQVHLPYVGPVGLWVLLFVFIPMGVALYLSFVKAGPYGRIIHEFTLDNYRALFTSARLMILARSLQYAVLTNIVCLSIGYPLAYWIVRNGGRFKLLFLGLIIVPSWISQLLRLYALRRLAGDPGILNSILLGLGVTSSPLKMLFNPTAVVFGLIYVWLPFMMLPIYASLEGLDQSLLEASVDLGATPFKRFFTVTLPLTKGGVFAGTILCLIPAFGDWLSPLVLGGDRVLMAGSLVRLYFVQIGNFPLGAAVAVVLTAAVLLMIYIFIKLGGEEAVERLV